MSSLPIQTNPKPPSLAAEEIRVRGIVQGVGFRPTVYRLAQQWNLQGEVWNDGQGVLIRLVGDRPNIDSFIHQLQAECPPLAQIDAIERTVLAQVPPYTGFSIVPSHSGPVQTKISPDAATCPQCRADIFDPFSRFYRYPFTNCTHCGPRLSIIRAIPYDRANTSMGAFALCPQCQAAYEDVNDRRFHAQPVACHICGPKAWLERADGQPIVADMFSMMDEVDAVCTLLQRGEIVAIKGLGGVHLACDATNEQAVQTLRQRKHRYDKPFALMARDLAIVQQYCQISEAERALLESPAAPIVLLKLKPESQNHAIAPSVAPGISTLGFMLPYTPLHHLVLRRMKRPIVLTSGNHSDEPQCIDNTEARQKLGTIADYFLLHDRAIVNRVDDSVVRVRDGQTQILRRARGYAPAPIALPAGFEQAPAILAMGSELKNTFCLVKDGQAILSQHLGDLEHAAAYAAYQDTLDLYLHLFEHQPQAIAVDTHPEYLSTKWGQTQAAPNRLPLHSIQHHHAHVAACMADNGLPLESPPVLGIALDGLGYGEDGTLWGGEFLLADYRQFTRLACFKPVSMIGGAQAIYQPWRNTYAHLVAAFNLPEGTLFPLRSQYGSLELFDVLEQHPLPVIHQLLTKGIQSPLASSCGRLFDGVAAAIGLARERCSYEGQAAILLEALAEAELSAPTASATAYPFAIVPSSLPILDPAPMWQALLTDLQQGRSAGAIALRFHRGLAQVLVQMVQQLQTRSPFTQVALTGGVFQNSLLHQLVQQQLQALGLTVLSHQRVPPNDGGLSLGQAAIAAARHLV